MKVNKTIATPKPNYNLINLALIVLLVLVFGLLVYGYRSVVRVEKMQTELQQQFLATDASVQRLTELSRAGTDIALPQIEYLIKIANINLTLNNNIAVAIRALQAADNAAAKLSDPKIIELRHALHHDIGALQTATVVDVPGILMRLDNVSDQVANLPVIPESLPKAKESVAAKRKPAPAMTASFWQKFYYYTLDKLSNIIIVHHTETTVQPLLSVSEQIYLAQNVQLLLDQAKWAVLHNRADIYSQSLTRANQLIGIYFAHNQTAANKITNELGGLQKINLMPIVPDISRSISVIEEIISAKGKP